MPQNWNLKVQEGIGILELNLPDIPINKLTSENLAELKNILTEVPKRSEMKALLFTSAKERFFIVGADIKEIEGIRTEEDAYQKAEAGKAVFQQIEDLAIPTICVINGACVGGGYELALACDFRTASFSQDVKVGLPEVNLGILPGFGGSIRMPRLLGLLKALPLILAGKMLGPEKALKVGMVDRLFHEQTLLEDSIKLAKEILEKGPTKIRRKKKTDLATWFLERTPIGRSIVFKKAQASVMKKTKGHYPAPIEIIHLLAVTYGRKGREPFKQESEYFAKLGATEISKNLIQLFFLGEKYKKHQWTSFEGKVPRIQKCGIVGAGVMGGGIAQRISYKDLPVKVKDINEKALLHALQEAQQIYSGALKRRRITKYDLARKMDLISVGPERIRIFIG